MTEAMIVEAVRAAQANTAADPAMMGGVPPGAPSAVADPAAVERFQAAMGVNGVSAPEAVDPIPFASEASAAWRSAQVNHQACAARQDARTFGGRDGRAAVRGDEPLVPAGGRHQGCRQVVDRDPDAGQEPVKSLVESHWRLSVAERRMSKSQP